MIWLALLIPVVAVIFLGVKFSKKMHWAEYIAVFLIPLICIIIGKTASVKSQTKDKEFWNNYATYAIYEEEWKEKWTEQVAVYRTETDSKGNSRQVFSHYRTDSHSKRHPEQWTLRNNTGHSHSISRSKFEEMCKLWNMRQFREMDRNHTSRRRREDNHKIVLDGDAYETKLPDMALEHIVPLCTQHTYENKVQCSGSVFNFQEVDEDTKETYGLFDYPNKDLFKFQTILGYTHGDAAERLRKYNAINGTTKQIHMMLLVFRGIERDAAFWQEAYWKGGNKNEVILCVGIDDKNIKWTKVISWTERATMKARVEREVREMGEFDALKVVDYMGTTIPNDYVRKEFKDFNYLTIQPSPRATLITYIITLVLTIGIGLFSVLNGFEHGDNNSWPHRRGNGWPHSRRSNLRKY